jgi:hypothetical protein
MGLDMKKKNEAAERIARLFDEECIVLTQVEEMQERVETAVYQKKWTDFEDAQSRLEALSARLGELEARRMALFSASGERVQAENFYLWAAALPAGERERLMEAYRALKFKTAKIRAAASAFSGYLTEMRKVVHIFLDAAFPERRGALYSRHGKSLGVDVRRAVLDKQF